MEEEKINNKRILTHKLSVVQNDIKIMKDTMFDLKCEMNEMKKLIMDIIEYNNNKESVKEEEKKNYWFYK